MNEKPDAARLALLRVSCLEALVAIALRVALTSDQRSQANSLASQAMRKMNLASDKDELEFRRMVDLVLGD